MHAQVETAGQQQRVKLAHLEAEQSRVAAQRMQLSASVTDLRRARIKKLRQARQCPSADVSCKREWELLYGCRFGRMGRRLWHWALCTMCL